MIQITGGQMPISGGTLTGPLAIAAGSAAAPGLAVAGDANTGLWAPAADTLAVSTGGVEAIRVTGAQRVGIGTVDPWSSLTIKNDASSSPGFHVGYSSTFSLGIGYDAGGAGVGYIGNSANNGSTQLSFRMKGFAAENTVMTLLGSGNIGIGLTAPTAALHLPASSTARASLRIPAGTAPTIPNAGDVWVAGTVIKFFDGTTTKEIAFV